MAAPHDDRFAHTNAIGSAHPLHSLYTQCIPYNTSVQLANVCGRTIKLGYYPVIAQQNPCIIVVVTLAMLYTEYTDLKRLFVIMWFSH